MFLYLPNDILQYIFNPYIDFNLNKNQLEFLINNPKFEFKVKSHLKLETIYDKLTLKIRYKERYVDNKLDGIQQGYYENGKIHAIRICKNGFAIGPNKWYYLNGELKSIYYFKTPQLIQDVYPMFISHFEICWHENGQLKLINKYNKKTSRGYYKYWDADGTLKQNKRWSSQDSIIDFILLISLYFLIMNLILYFVPNLFLFHFLVLILGLYLLKIKPMILKYTFIIPSLFISFYSISIYLVHN